MNHHTNKPKYQDYIHNFSSWTAARAIQRNFASTIIIKDSLRVVGMKAELIKLEKNRLIDDEYFDKWHSSINSALRKELIKKVPKEKVTYGRISKLIAIYIKTAHIIRNPYDKLSQIAHIPVDRILLENISTFYQIKELNPKLISWTLLDKRKYDFVIKKLREIRKKENHLCFWMLEKYWVI